MPSGKTACAGGSARTAAPGRRLDLRERLALFADACECVQREHERGFTRGFLQPSFVRVAEANGRAVVKFRQGYKSDTLNTSGAKILTLVKNNDRWQIVQERMN